LAGARGADDTSAFERHHGAKRAPAPNKKRDYMRKSNNLLVGSKVLIDWPIRWKATHGFNEQHSAQLRAEAEKTEHYFGKTGTIMAYNPAADDAKELKVLLDGSGELVDLYQGAVTVTQPAKLESEIMKEFTEAQNHTNMFLQIIVDLLQNLVRR
jgi:hypothetical protein